MQSRDHGVTPVAAFHAASVLAVVHSGASHLNCWPPDCSGDGTALTAPVNGLLPTSIPSMRSRPAVMAKPPVQPVGMQPDALQLSEPGQRRNVATQLWLSDGSNSSRLTRPVKGGMVP